MASLGTNISSRWRAGGFRTQAEAAWETLNACIDRACLVLAYVLAELTEVQISHELSWERTAQDLVWEVIYNRDP
jgi:hypothetical protein